MSKKIDWHRLMGLILQPMFERFGYETEVEVDLSFKKQLIDLTVVRKTSSSPQGTLPAEYLHPFEPLNDHNLISFKSHRESFIGVSLEELYGHASNYRKKHQLAQQQVNLYALVHHEPVQLLKSFRGTEFLVEIRKNEIYELKLSTMSPVRFIITQQSQHPLLTLFSNDREKVLTQFPEFYQERGLFEEISRYLYRLIEYYGIMESNRHYADF
ncbi:hypothetical protein WDW89_20995 [Deltaproteobacteria bacterium TL4]